MGLHQDTTAMDTLNRYKEIPQDGCIIIWDEAARIGLKFKKGDTLQRYTASVVLEDFGLLQKEGAMSVLEDAQRRLLEVAAERYPKEFEELKTERG